MDVLATGLTAKEMNNMLVVDTDRLIGVKILYWHTNLLQTNKYIKSCLHLVRKMTNR